MQIVKNLYDPKNYASQNTYVGTLVQIQMLIIEKIINNECFIYLIVITFPP